MLAPSKNIATRVTGHAGKNNARRFYTGLMIQHFYKRLAHAFSHGSAQRRTSGSGFTIDRAACNVCVMRDRGTVYSITCASPCPLRITRVCPPFVKRFEMTKIVLFATLVLLSHQASAEVIPAELFKAINERLGYMEDVALFKAQNHLAIEDIEREQIVIDKAKKSAADKGLDPDSVEAFFKAQISVAKAIQFRYRADLLSQPSSREPKDLKREIRPQLISLGNQIIRQMTMYLEAHGAFKPVGFADFDAALTVAYVTVSDKQFLFKALQTVKLSRQTD